MQTTSMMSNIAMKYDFLQERAQRRPIREGSMDTTGDGGKKTDIGHLKELYLQRLAKTEPNVAARLGAKLCQGGVQPQASGQQVARPSFGPAAARDIEDLEIMCNNCFNLIKSSEAASCTGDPASCPTACRNGGCEAAERPKGPLAVIDLKLKKLRIALESRLRDTSATVNVMRNLTQLRYHIETAAKWTPGCSEIGALSDHTVQQVRQLTATSRVLAPPVYIFSKRIENVVIQKERELRRALVHTSASKASESTRWGTIETESQRDRDESVADVKSIVSELDSDCGTQYAETAITQDGQGSSDVGNVQDANDFLSLKNEDEQRRWFYAQTLTVKLSLTDKARARKTLISDLYARVRQEGVPIEGWVAWIRKQLSSDELDGLGPARSSRLELDRTPLPAAPSYGVGDAASKLSESFPSRLSGSARVFAPTSRGSPAARPAALLRR